MNEFFKMVGFSDVDALLSSFIKEDFSYHNDLKPARLLRGKDENENILAYNCIGLSKDDIKISVKSSNGTDYLYIKGYNKNEYGLEFSIKNTFVIRKIIDKDNIEAKVENGVLYVTLKVKDEYKNKEKYVNIK